MKIPRLKMTIDSGLINHVRPTSDHLKDWLPVYLPVRHRGHSNKKDRICPARCGCMQSVFYNGRMVKRPFLAYAAREFMRSASKLCSL